MTDDDVTYFTHRAAVEHARAAQATRPEAIRAHAMLATVYRDRLAAARPDSQFERV